MDGLIIYSHTLENQNTRDFLKKQSTEDHTTVSISQPCMHLLDYSVLLTVSVACKEKAANYASMSRSMAMDVCRFGWLGGRING